MSELDVMDLRLATALQVDGRASYSRIAAVLGVSDQTVARRYARLRSSGALRVVGLTDPDATGDLQWFVRVHTTPGAAQAIAAALAKREDTSWVMLVAGGTEILCTVRTEAVGRGEDLLLSALPRTAQVLDIQAYCRLHQYFGSQRGAVERLELLGPEQVTALLDGRPVPEQPRDGAILDEVDRLILDELAVDGRCSLERLARVTSSSPATVRRRIEALRDRGVLFFDVELPNRLPARSVESVLWVKVDPAALHRAGTALAMHSEVAFAAACTGPFALLAYVMTADARSLYRYLTTSLAALPGVREVSSAPVIRLVKGPGVRLADRS